MVKIIMKRVPQKIDQSVQYKVMKNWCATMIETHSPGNDVKMISGKELSQRRKQTRISKTK